MSLELLPKIMQKCIIFALYFPLYQKKKKKKVDNHIIMFLWHCNNFGNCEVLFYTVSDDFFLNNYQ